MLHKGHELKQCWQSSVPALYFCGSILWPKLGSAPGIEEPWGLFNRLKSSAVSPHSKWLIWLCMYIPICSYMVFKVSPVQVASTLVGPL